MPLIFYEDNKEAIEFRKTKKKTPLRKGVKFWARTIVIERKLFYKE